MFEFFDNAFLNDLLYHALTVVLIAALTLTCLKTVNIIYKRLMKKTPGERTRLGFIKYLLNVLIGIGAIVGILLQIPPLKNFMLSIAAGSGIAAVVIGFASQDALSNLVSGFFISFFSPFKVGDRVKIVEKSISGTVVDISLRHTVIKTVENTHIIVPNNVINSAILENSNFGDDRVCTLLNIGISFDSDIQRAMDIIIDEVHEHKSFFDQRTITEISDNVEPVKVAVVNIGEYSIDLRAWIWSRDVSTGFSMVCDLRKSIKQRFDAEHIEMPFPYTNVIIKGNE